MNPKWYYENGAIKYEVISFEENKVPYMDIINLCPLISPELEELVENNFKTIDQKTLCWTRVAAFASILGMLGAIIMPFLASSKIDKVQYDGIIKSITNDTIIVKDTIMFNFGDTCIKVK